MRITKGHMGKIGVCLLAMALVLPLLASSASAQELRKITFRYSWILYGHAPAYYYTKELGLWEKEGLDVTILTGKGSGTSVKLMGAETGPLRHRGLRYDDEGRRPRHSRQGGFRRVADPSHVGGDSRQARRHDAGGPRGKIHRRHRGRR